MKARMILCGAIAMAISIAACSVEPGDPASATAIAAASPTPTLNPNQLEELRRSQGTGGSVSTTAPTISAVRSGEPTSTPAPRPTPSPYDPALEAMLPSSLRGIALGRYSSPASAFATGGDMCSFVCPMEPARLAAAAGIPVEKIDIAFAFPDQSSGLVVAVMAIRFRGVATSRLIDVRIAEGGALGHGDGLPADRQSLRVGSHAVTRVTYPPFYQPEQGEYLTAHDDVLFVVFGAPPSAASSVPDDVALAIAALP